MCGLLPIRKNLKRTNGLTLLQVRRNTFDMTTEQLKQYADELGLDYTGIKYKKDLRNLIKDHLI